MGLKLTDIMHPGDWFIHQTKFGNWVLGQATTVEDTGDIGCCIFNRETGAEAIICHTLKEVCEAALKRGMTRTWKIGYHRWKVEAV